MSDTTRGPDRLAEYRAVAAKVDAKFGEIRARHPAAFRCDSGCHACCAPGLTVTGVERAALAAHVRSTPGLRQVLEALALAQPHGDTRCALLDADGRCSVYAARPLLCRSHGAPVRVRSEAGARLDVCGLNFTTQPLEALAATDLIDVETLNTLLFVVQRRFDPADAGERFPLTVAGILGPDLP